MQVRVAYAPVVEIAVGLGGDELSAAERDCRARFRSPKRRAEWLAGRRAAKAALGGLFERIHGRPAEAEEFEILAGPRGEPRVSGGAFGVSISHSQGLAAAAAWYSAWPGAQGVGVGLDIEWIRPMDFGITEQFCSPSEIDELQRTSSPSERDLAILRLWTAKEAIYKASFPRQEVDVRLLTLPSLQYAIQSHEERGYVVTLALSLQSGKPIQVAGMKMDAAQSQ